MRRPRLPCRLRLEGISRAANGLRHQASAGPQGIRGTAHAPIFTPATKAESGHDENISFEQAARIVGADIAEQARAASP
jgi:hypothetical protein